MNQTEQMLEKCSARAMILHEFLKNSKALADAGIVVSELEQGPFDMCLKLPTTSVVPTIRCGVYTNANYPFEYKHYNIFPVQEAKIIECALIGDDGLLTSCPELRYTDICTHHQFTTHSEVEAEILRIAYFRKRDHTIDRKQNEMYAKCTARAANLYGFLKDLSRAGFRVCDINPEQSNSFDVWLPPCSIVSSVHCYIPVNENYQVASDLEEPKIVQLTYTHTKTPLIDYEVISCYRFQTNEDVKAHFVWLASHYARGGTSESLRNYQVELVNTSQRCDTRQISLYMYLKDSKTLVDAGIEVKPGKGGLYVKFPSTSDISEVVLSVKICADFHGNYKTKVLTESKILVKCNITNDFVAIHSHELEYNKYTLNMLESNVAVEDELIRLSSHKRS